MFLIGADFNNDHLEEGKPRSPASLSCFFAAVQHAYFLKDKPDPLKARHDSLVSKWLIGVDNLAMSTGLKKKTKRAPTITYDQLNAIRVGIFQEGPRCRLQISRWLAHSLKFFLLLRKCDLLHHMSEDNILTMLSHAHITLAADLSGLKLTLPLGRKRNRGFAVDVPTAARPGDLCCPVMAYSLLSNWDVQHNSVNVPLFHQTKAASYNQQLTDYTLIQDIYKYTGVVTTSHTYRRSGAQFFLLQGKSYDDIKIIGQWHCDIEIIRVYLEDQTYLTPAAFAPSKSKLPNFLL